MPVQHVKGQPAVSTNVREKWGVKIEIELRTPSTSTYVGYEESRLFLPKSSNEIDYDTFL